MSLCRLYEKKIEVLNDDWVVNLNNSLQELKQKLNIEKEKAVQLAVKQAKGEEQLKLEKCIQSYENKLDLLKDELNSKYDLVSELNSRIGALQYENQELRNLLDDVRSEFQKFIEQYVNLKQGEGEFLFLKDQRK